MTMGPESRKVDLHAAGWREILGCLVVLWVVGAVGGLPGSAGASATADTITVTLGGSDYLLTDATAETHTRLSGLRYNRRTRTFLGFARVTNTSATALGLPLVLVIDHLSDPSVSLANADGLTGDGRPFVDLTPRIRGTTLAPGRATGSVALSFLSPRRHRFTFHATVYAPGATNNPPVANAGSDQTLLVGDTATLDGSGSADPDGDPLTFLWQLTPPAGSHAALSDPTAVRPTFQVDVAGSYVAELVVNDGATDSAPDTVTLTTTNSPPVANAGADQSVFVGETVTLDGSGSSDADGDLLTFLWSFTTVPPGSTAAFNDATAVMPSFTLDLPGTYFAELVVNDGTTDSTPDTVRITTTNSPPVADAGPDQTVFVGDTVLLDGTASHDPDGDPLTYHWSLTATPAGSAALLSDPTAITPSFFVDLPGEYLAQLIVDDGTVASPPDTVTITTANSPPVADAGPDQTPFVDAVVTLDGSGSSDVDHDPLTYRWSFTTLPAGSGATLSDPTAVAPTFTPDCRGIYVVQLIVNDGSRDSAPATVTITPQNRPPVASATADAATLAAGTAVHLDGTGSHDPDHDALTYLWSLQRPTASTATLDDPTAATPTFVADVAGDYVARLVVNDGDLDSAPAAVAVTATPVNRPPNLLPPGNRTIGIAPFTTPLFAVDPDGDPLTFSLVTGPAGMAVTPAGTLSWTPTAADLGAHPVTVQVSDGALTDPESFTVTVAIPAAQQLPPPNQPPTLDPIPDADLTLGATLHLTATATDPEGSPLSFALFGPPGMTIDPATGAIAFTPAADQVGLHDVTVQVTDGAGLTDARPFVVTVRQPNRPPVAVDDVYTARLGETLTVPGPGVLANDTDLDGDPLTALLVADPSRGTLSLNPDGSFDYTPTVPHPTGVYTTQAVTDADLTLAFPAPKLSASTPLSDIKVNPYWDGVDGRLDTSWQANWNGGAPNEVWYDQRFFYDVTVKRIELFSDRGLNTGNGHDLRSARFLLYDAGDQLLCDTGVIPFPDVALPPDQRDVVVTVADYCGSPVAGVRRVRLSSTDYESQLPAFAELHVIGDGTVHQSNLAVENIFAPAPGGYFPYTPGVTAADLNGDGKAELVAPTGGNGSAFHITVFNGSDGSELCHIDTPQFSGFQTGLPAPAPAALDLFSQQWSTLADIDGDGRPEILLPASVHPSPTYDRVAAFEDDCTFKWVSDPVSDGDNMGNGTHDTAPAVADLDGDGNVEIVVGYHAAVNFHPMGRITIFDHHGTLLARSAPTLSQERLNGTTSNPIIADIDLDGSPEILFYATVYDANASVRWSADPTVFDYAAQQTVPVNLDDDPQAEVVMVFANGTLAAFEHDGTLKWSVPGAAWGPTHFSVADLDGDGHPNIVVTQDREICAYDQNGVKQWCTPHQRTSKESTFMGVYATTAFDFDGDGVMEVVFRGAHDLMFFDGRDGTLLWARRLLGVANFSYDSNALILDQDGDGQAEIVYNARDDRVRSRLWILGPATGTWPAARPIWNTPAYHITNINSDGTVPSPAPINWLTPGLNNFRVNVPLPEERQDRRDSFTYKASDGALDSNTATVNLEILPPGAPPQILSQPLTDATKGFPYRYPVLTFDPDVGDVLTYRLTSAPAGMTIDTTTGVVTWTPGAGDVGDHAVGITVTDSVGLTALQTYTLTVGAPVTVPDLVGQPRAAAEAAVAAAHLAVGRVTESHDATAPAGTVTGQSPPAGAVAERGAPVDLGLSLGPAPGDTDGDGDGFTPNQGDCNDTDASVHPGATDTAGDGVDQNCDGADGVLNIDHIVVEPATGHLLPGDSLPLTATAILADGTSLDLTTLAGWSSSDTAVATVDGQGRVTAVAPGSATLTASHLGVSGSATLQVAAPATGDDIPPVATITTPAEAAEVTAPVAVVGTASDAELLDYELAVAPAGSTDFTPLASATTPVVDGPLGRLDPTLLRNGLYTVRLTVRDRGGNQTTAERLVQVAGAMKVGNFTLAFTDLTLPMSGIPITVTRSYDSRDKAQGDFGIGWRLGVESFECRASGVLGDGWRVVRAGLAYGLQPTRAHQVSCTLPDGRVEAFDLQVTPTVSPLVPFPPSAHRASFQPLPGTRGTLESLDNNYLTLLDPQPGEVRLLDDTTFNPYAPQRFRYTGADGTRIVLTLGGGIETITDPNGNTLTFDAAGIHHSAGKSVLFTRDPDGRITGITDPEGHTQSYAYDTNGDLVAHTDAEGNTTRFKYNRSHGLIEILDPLNRPLARNDYDGNGRLIRTTGADGRVIELGHNIDTRQEVVTDAAGAVTVMEYDDHGNVVRVTDPLGNVTTHTYDSDDNLLTTTNAEGETTTYTYDGRGNRLTKTDPLGHTTTRTYDADNRVTTVTDPLGRVTTYTYDSRGNLLTRTNALGVAEVQNTYDAAGNLLTTTDAVGSTTSYEYDAAGNRTARIDALGRRTTFTYDANGNPIAETDRRGQTTATTYDGRGLYTGKTDPLGNTSTFDYTVAGQLARTTDPLGNTTLRELDAAGKLLATVDAVGNRTERQYDLKGNFTQILDPLGRATQMQYDALDRRIKTLLPDGSATQLAYDRVGRIVAQTDARGNTTHFTYDAAGHNVATTDALGNTTTFEYDAAGNMTRMVDANGHAFTFAYDALNRRTRTTFPDGTFEAVAYDAAGHVTSQTDALGNTTTFTYDALGRLVKVTDPLGGETTYAYDEEGHLLAQTDALGHTTTFTYDANGHRTSKSYPDGATETWSYDAGGNTHTVTDANGDTTVQSFDPDGRLVRKLLPDGSEERYTYTATGKVATATNPTGTVTRTYDVNDRLVRLDNADGSRIEYTYDGAGNLASEAAYTAPTATPRTTTYTYDGNNRLATVTDADGGVTTHTYDGAGNLATVTRPNGVTTTYTYDANNRLVDQVIANGTTVLEHYTYQVDAAGDRTRVTRKDGTVVTYAYDALRRLVQERWQLPGGADRTVDYAYDAVGNRVRKTTLEGTTTTEVLYTYDEVDRLVREVTTVTTAAAGDPAATGLIIAGYGASPLLALGLLGVVNRRRGAPWHEGGIAAVLAPLTGLGPLALCLTFELAVPQAAEAAGSTTSVVTYTYDADGRLQSRSDGSGTTLYDFDAEDRLQQVSGPAGTVAYAYDAEGRRIARQGPSGTTGFVVDPNNPTGFTQVAAEHDGAGNLTADYTWGNRLIRQARGGQVRYLHQDASHNVRLLTDGAGNISDTYDYEAFGPSIGTTGTTENAYRFAGERLDPDTGLTYLRARYYDPNTGRFISRDPFAGNLRDPMSLHRYLYANADPVINLDPAGLTSLAEIMVGLGVVAFLLSVIVPNTGRSKSKGYTDKFSLEINFGLTLGTGAVGGAIYAKIKEREAHYLDPAYDTAVGLDYFLNRREVKRIGTYAVFLFGLGAGLSLSSNVGKYLEAIWHGAIIPSSIDFTTTGTRTLEQFAGMGRITAAAAGVGVQAITLADGKYIPVSQAGISGDLQVTIFTALAIWSSPSIHYDPPVPQVYHMHG